MENIALETQTLTIVYHIVDQWANTPMRAIPLQNIPNFHGMAYKDPNTFMFEFDVLCRGLRLSIYHSPSEIELFHSTLKGATLCYFLGLGGSQGYF